MSVLFYYMMRRLNPVNKKPAPTLPGELDYTTIMGYLAWGEVPVLSVPPMTPNAVYTSMRDHNGLESVTDNQGRMWLVIDRMGRPYKDSYRNLRNTDYVGFVRPLDDADPETRFTGHFHFLPSPDYMMEYNESVRAYSLPHDISLGVLIWDGPLETYIFAGFIIGYMTDTDTFYLNSGRIVKLEYCVTWLGNQQALIGRNRPGSKEIYYIFHISSLITQLYTCEDDALMPVILNQIDGTRVLASKGAKRSLKLDPIT